ncbi:hypothetical protein ABEF95_015157 [Exophiala dermatitidis]
MARLNTQIASSESETESQILSSSPSRAAVPRTSETPPSPTLASDSDKENQNRGLSLTSKGKGKRTSAAAAIMPESERRAGTGAHSSSQHTSKRRRVSSGEDVSHTQKQFYDPEQNPEERRLVRKGLRSLFARLHDSKTEYLRPDSKGLEETLREADELYKNVKQTSEATIDSRLLVETADLSYRKINNLTLGDGSLGIDVDDFVTKCIGFMRLGDESDSIAQSQQPPSGTQSLTQTQRRRRSRHAAAAELEDVEDEIGDTLNWEYLGRNACFLYNSRPCLTGFLLGPLSVQKKTRQQTQRKAREARTDATQAVRPVELGDEDLAKQESVNLTVICTAIARLLQHTQETGMANVEKEYDEYNASNGDDEDAELSEDQIRAILKQHRMADNGCVPLFDFCINPRSFGQSVENLFYVSFLIKEGKVGLDFDSTGQPTLGIAATRTVAERQERPKNQAVFTLDFDVWEDIVATFDIEESIIPHRVEETYDDGIMNETTAAGGNGDDVDLLDLDQTQAARRRGDDGEEEVSDACS